MDAETVFWVLVVPETIEVDNSFETLSDPVIIVSTELIVILLVPELNIALQFESLELNLPTLLLVPTIYEYSETISSLSVTISNLPFVSLIKPTSYYFLLKVCFVAH